MVNFLIVMILTSALKIRVLSGAGSGPVGGFLETRF